MLDDVAPDGMACMTGDFDAELEWLFAQPDPLVSERAGVQLMTIHKAKGLGFDVVIVPGMDRKSKADEPSLITSLERTTENGQSEMLVAPIGARGGEKHPTYSWVQKLRAARQDEEVKRLLYVACTRARRELHLLGTATVTQSGLKGGDAKSLLEVGWPAFEVKFNKAAAARAAKDRGQQGERGGDGSRFSAGDDAPGEPVRCVRYGGERGEQAFVEGEAAGGAGGDQTAREECNCIEHISGGERNAGVGAAGGFAAGKGGGECGACAAAAIEHGSVEPAAGCGIARTKGAEHAAGGGVFRQSA